MTHKYDHTIFLVDDEKPILKALKRLFRRKGHRILMASNGREGVDQLKKLEKPVSLIISDQRMPEMTGAQFLEKAKTLFPEAIRFLLTGYSDMDAVMNAVNKGEIHRYLTKPWNDEDLLLQVDQALGQYELVQENKRLTELSIKQNDELRKLNEGLEEKVRERTEEIVQQNKELEKAYEKLEKSFFDTVRLISSLIETMNPRLGQHIKKVSALARKIGEDFNLSEKDLNNIEMAGLVHDVGLLGLPEYIWEKFENEMKPVELEMYSNHPVIASVSFETVEKFDEVGQIILHHHEHYDGSGFPSGVKGDGIPLGSRIIGAISDYYRIMDSWPESKMKVIMQAKKLLGPSVDEMEKSDRDSLVNDIMKKILSERASKIYDPDVVSKLVKRLGFQNINEGEITEDGDIVKVHYSDLKEGMMLASELRTVDGRFVLASNAVLNKMLLKSIQRLGKSKAIKDKLIILDTV